MKKAALLTISALGTLMTGCAALNPAGESQFACKGDQCPTPIEVYSETHNAPPSVEMGRTPKQWRGGGQWKAGKEGEGESDIYLKRALDLAPQAQSASGNADDPPFKPIREPAQVARIWIAPWIDQNDNLHANGYVFTEVQSQSWSFGEPEIRHSLGLQSLPIQ
ncbi:type IV conjugative transfer system lipoprotein TraV [Allochromatium humboldtianum]|uniref:Type IV conjugative transfer system lipoprotein TraV n=1 Tax=Allochromatium humboldtianum TaxID=504901 RepID=A0A850RRI5_9GAMM|nr:type IV conjugative transfer system lipoprotein TraV [Allochromatium humboldtianum]